MPYKHNEPRRHKIPKARYRVENWREYEAALRDRGSLTVWVTPEAIAAWHPARTGRPGRSAHYSDLAIETGVMLRLAFARPWRQTEGLLRSVTRLLGLSLDAPDHTTLSRRSAALSLVTALAVPAGPVTVVIDSTGLKVFGAGEWRMAKHGGRDRRTWRKLHLAIDPDTGEVLASALTTTEEGDVSLVRPLLDQIAAPIAAVLADGAYDGDPVYRAVADRAPAATVIIPPRATAVVSEVSATGTPTPRDRHIEMIAAKGRLGWQKAVGYGRRSLVETGMLPAIFVSLELSRSTWLITSLSPGAGEKMSKHSIRAGDVAGLLVRLAQLKEKARGRTGRDFPIIAIQEAGLDGFWIHRVLQSEGIESHVVDAASILTSRRRRRAKTDGIDGETLVRTLLAYKRGEPRVCAMVKAPTPEE